ncbi:hypothetical protein [Paenibacillus nasutitermitis]|uniref:hypothetical protein n=1 Tax=Paenibacillus nasutitermitis TaxID=1652958 RepID=UPI001665659B|nr:hypothetical protein [Paenibacillus nasutitermitis]
MALGCVLGLALSLVLPAGSVIGMDTARAADGVPSQTPNMRTVGQFAPYTVIEDFESPGAAAGWQAGENVAEVGLAEQAWNVFFPYEGSKFLAMKSVPNLQTTSGERRSARSTSLWTFRITAI